MKFLRSLHQCPSSWKGYHGGQNDYSSGFLISTPKNGKSDQHQAKDPRIPAKVPDPTEMNFPSELILAFFFLFFFDAPGPNRVIQDNSFAGYIPEVKVPSFFLGVGGGRREERRGGEREVGTFRAIRWQLL